VCGGCACIRCVHVSVYSHGDCVEVCVCVCTAWRCSHRFVRVMSVYSPGGVGVRVCRHDMFVVGVCVCRHGSVLMHGGGCRHACECVRVPRTHSQDSWAASGLQL
jgi:hypothetical protein